MKYVVTKISVGHTCEVFKSNIDFIVYMIWTHFFDPPVILCQLIVEEIHSTVFSKTGPNCFIIITFSNFNYILYFSYFHFSLNLCNVQLVMALFLKLKGKANCQLYFINISIVLVVFGLPPAAGCQVSHTSHWVTTTCSKPSVVSLKPCFWIHFTVVFPNK
jgi:hypothetical protein